MNIELLKQELQRRFTPPMTNQSNPLQRFGMQTLMLPPHLLMGGPMAPETNLATNTPQGLDTIRAILAIAMAGQAGQQGLQQLQSGMLQNRYNAGVENAYNRLPEGLFNPAQSGAIKSRLGDYVAGGMPELNPNVMPMYSGAGVPAKIGQTIPFNLRTPELLSKLSQEIATPQQILGFLSGKVRKSELEGLGISQFLQGKDKVSKQDLLSHIQQSTPQIEEVVKGNIKPRKITIAEQKELDILQQQSFNHLENFSPEQDIRMRELQGLLGVGKDTTKFGPNTHPTMSLPGGSNYKEVVIKAPVKPWTSGVGGIESGEFGTGKTRNDVFKSSHWDEPNVLSHIRMNDRTTPDGKKVLFIEEIQSDWAKKVRESGIGRKPLPEGWKVGMLPKGTWAILDENGKWQYTGETEQAMWKDYESESGNMGVPSHPLLKNWQELTLKRALKEAVDKGYDYVSWTTGEQQAERYDLSKQVDSIKWKISSDRIGGAEGFKQVDVKTKEKGAVSVTVNPKGKVELASDSRLLDKNLDEIIGKEHAKKVIDGKEGNLSGLELKIGGEWAKNLYDKQIPNTLQDLTNGEIQNILMPLNKMNKDGNPIYMNQPALRITPEMKQEIKTKGFDLFSKIDGDFNAIGTKSKKSHYNRGIYA